MDSMIQGYLESGNGAFSTVNKPSTIGIVTNGMLKEHVKRMEQRGSLKRIGRDERGNVLYGR